MSFVQASANQSKIKGLIKIDCVLCTQFMASDDSRELVVIQKFTKSVPDFIFQKSASQSQQPAIGSQFCTIMQVGNHQEVLE